MRLSYGREEPAPRDISSHRTRALCINVYRALHQATKETRGRQEIGNPDLRSIPMKKR
jgi:hypothetical protein